MTTSAMDLSFAKQLSVRGQTQVTEATRQPSRSNLKLEETGLISEAREGTARLLEDARRRESQMSQSRVEMTTAAYSPRIPIITTADARNLIASSRSQSSLRSRGSIDAEGGRARHVRAMESTKTKRRTHADVQAVFPDETVLVLAPAAVQRLNQPFDLRSGRSRVKRTTRVLPVRRPSDGCSRLHRAPVGWCNVSVLGPYCCYRPRGHLPIQLGAWGLPSCGFRASLRLPLSSYSTVGWSLCAVMPLSHRLSPCAEWMQLSRGDECSP